MSAVIHVSELGGTRFRVVVRDGSTETAHEVTVPEHLFDKPELRDQDLTRAVHESFLFLLERERASSILARFSLDDITRYFPEYPEELARRLSRPATSSW